MVKARCADCGFLALRHKETRELHDAELPIRDGTAVHADIKAYAWPPLCTKLRAEFPTAGTSGVIQEERECSDFTQWQQGFTPKEHQEALDRQKQLDWQTKREDDDRQWRKQAREEDRKARRVDAWTVAIIAGIFALGGSALTVVLTEIIKH